MNWWLRHTLLTSLSTAICEYLNAGGTVAVSLVIKVAIDSPKSHKKFGGLPGSCSIYRHCWVLWQGTTMYCQTRHCCLVCLHKYSPVSPADGGPLDFIKWFVADTKWVRTYQLCKSFTLISFFQILLFQTSQLHPFYLVLVWQKWTKSAILEGWVSPVLTRGHLDEDWATCECILTVGTHSCPLCTLKSQN